MQKRAEVVEAKQWMMDEVRRDGRRDCQSTADYKNFYSTTMASWLILKYMRYYFIFEQIAPLFTVLFESLPQFFQRPPL